MCPQTVYILGVQHAIQEIETGLDHDHNRKVKQRYKMLVQELIQRYQINLLAEEAKRDGTTIAREAVPNGCRYVNIEISAVEKESLGLKPGYIQQPDAADIYQNQMWKRHTLMYQNCMNECRQDTKALLICGAAHLDHFREQLHCDCPQTIVMTDNILKYAWSKMVTVEDL